MQSFTPNGMQGKRPSSPSNLSKSYSEVITGTRKPRKITATSDEIDEEEPEEDDAH